MGKNMALIILSVAIVLVLMFLPIIKVTYGPGPYTAASSPEQIKTYHTNAFVWYLKKLPELKQVDGIWYQASFLRF